VGNKGFVRWVVGTLLWCALSVPQARAADLKWEPIKNGGIVPVKIDWQSFVDLGFPGTLAQLVQAVVAGSNRWHTSTGIPVLLNYTGTSSDCVPGGVLIRMEDSFSGRAAGTYGCDWPDGVLVAIYRGSTSGTDFDWTFWGGSDSEYDVQSTITHELGHVLLGNDHDSTGATWSSLDGSSYRWTARFGPFTPDVNRVRTLWGASSDGVVHLERSTDQGVTFATFGALPSNLRTLSNIGAVRDNSRLILSYKSHGGSPCWIIGSTTGTFDTGQWWCWGGLKGLHGVNIAGDDDEYMITWADADSDGSPVVKVAYGTAADLADGNGVYRNPSSSLTIGTPSVAKLGPNHWALAYAKLDSSDTNTGRIAVRLSTDDGKTWSSEIYPVTSYHADNGVTMAANQGTDELRISFSFSAYNGNGGSYAENRYLRTIRATASGTSLTYNGMMYPTIKTQSAPGMARAANYYHTGTWLGQGSYPYTTFRTTMSGTSWTDPRTTYLTLSSPAVAADDSYTYVFLFGTNLD